MYTAESYGFPHNVHVDSLLWMDGTHLQRSPADGSANQRLFLADTFIFNSLNRQNHALRQG